MAVLNLQSCDTLVLYNVEYTGSSLNLGKVYSFTFSGGTPSGCYTYNAAGTGPAVDGVVTVSSEFANCISCSSPVPSPSSTPTPTPTPTVTPTPSITPTKTPTPTPTPSPCPCECMEINSNLSFTSTGNTFNPNNIAYYEYLDCGSNLVTIVDNNVGLFNVCTNTCLLVKAYFWMDDIYYESTTFPWSPF